jgi:hypothetical protein
MSRKQPPKIRRAYVTLEFYNTPSLDRALSKLRKELLEGIESSEDTITHHSRPLHFEFKQTFVDTHQRENLIALVDGRKCELVRSVI